MSKVPNFAFVPLIIVILSCEGLFPIDTTGVQQTRQRARSVQAGTILFISNHVHLFTPTSASQLYSMNEDGSSIRKLTSDTTEWVWDANYSPDGENIAFVLNQPVRPGAVDTISGLYVMNVNGSGRRRIAFGVQHPVWSPDSRRILYNIQGGEEALDARGNIVIGLDGFLTSIPQHFPYPFFVNDWSRDGRELLGINLVPAYDSAKRLLPFGRIVYCSLDGDSVGSWGQVGNMIGSPVYSRKGDKIAFSGHNSNHNGRAAFTMDRHGSRETLLEPTNRPYRDFEPVCYSPDDAKLLCNAGPGGGFWGSVLVIDLQTGVVKDITPFKNDTTYSYAVSWRRNPSQ